MRQNPSSTVPASPFGVGLAFALVAALAPAVAAAQVLELAPDGGVTVYDHPAVFDGSEVRPLVVAPPRAPAPSVSAAVNRAALEADVNPRLVEAVAWSESRLKPGLVSRAGAVGEMQLMPGTARALGVDPWDTEQNLRGGATYLKQMLHRYDGDLVHALAAYNAGPGAVDRWGGVPPYPETRAYVAAVLDRLSRAPDRLAP